MKNKLNCKKGKSAEFIVMYELLKRNFNVFRPVNEDSVCDFILEKNNKLIRIQLKSSFTLRKDEIKNFINGKNYSSTLERYFFRLAKNKGERYTKEDVDFVICFIEPTKDYYIFPIKLANKIGTFTINPTSKRNNKYMKLKNNFSLLELF